MNRTLVTLFCAALGSNLAGCASTTPEYDARFGDAVRSTRLAQTLNPQAGENNEPVNGLDGKATREAVVRYYDSFKSPPPVTNVINIGGSLSGN